MHDRALQNRLLDVEERDGDISARFIEIVEAYYGLQPEIRQVPLTNEDLDYDEPSSDCIGALADLGVTASVVRVSGSFDSVTLKRFTISPSPTFTATVN